MTNTLHDNIVVNTDNKDDIVIEWQQGTKTFAPVKNWSHLQHYASRDALVFGTIYDKKQRKLVKNETVCYVGELKKSTTKVVSKNKVQDKVADPEFVEYYIYNAASYVLQNNVWVKTLSQHVVNVSKETFDARAPHILRLKNEEPF